MPGDHLKKFLHSKACADHVAQDERDDKKAGVKSMAVHLGKAIRPVLTIFDTIFFACLLWAGYLNDQHVPFYIMGVLAPFLLCLWHIWSFDQNDPKDCWKKFTVRPVAIVMYPNVDLCDIPGRPPRRGDGLRWIDRRSPLQTLVLRRVKIQIYFAELFVFCDAWSGTLFRNLLHHYKLFRRAGNIRLQYTMFDRFDSQVVTY
jgi:hypothetical protein